MSTSGEALALRFVDVDPQDDQLLRQVVMLADDARRTLGFMPPAAFSRAAANGTLIAAVHDGRVVGYALYSLPRQIVRLTHLCVCKSMRGRGIARQLVDLISQRHADRFAITLKCRKDYRENNLWPHLGFVLQGEHPGRSRRRLPLCIWRKDHGHPDLFSTVESVGVLRVSLDLDVFLDIESDSIREEAIESRALAEDWLAGQIEFVATPELRRQFAGVEDGPDKEWQYSSLQRYPSVTPVTGVTEAMIQRLMDHVLTTQGLDLSANQKDRSDARYVAEAALGGVTVLATRDDRFLRWAESAVDVCGVRILRPADIILEVDELTRAQAYRPVQLQHTEYRLTAVRSGSENELLTFRNEIDGELRSQYQTRVRSLLAEGPLWTRMILRSPDGAPIAFYAVGLRDNEIVVPILRINAPSLENTVARQLLFTFRELARNDRCSIVRITDPFLSKYTADAVREDGYISRAQNWVAFSISCCGSASTIDVIAKKAADKTGLRVETLHSGLSAAVAADLERTLWPAKIIDSDLPTYLIPINPVWSAELFGIPETLFPRANMLGMSREHVYYRSPKPRTERAPARLVWYVTRSGAGGIAAVIGCSRLEEIVTDGPAALSQTFRHLGVWQQEQIDQVASDGQALALRFADTEIFPNAVSLPRLRRFADKYGPTLSLRSPQRISAELFSAIYQEGYSKR